MWEERIFLQAGIVYFRNGSRADATLTDFFNPLLGRDASYPCLISIEPKEGCNLFSFF